MMLIVLTVSTMGCKKDWMEEKRDLSLVVPSSLKDMRALLNDVNTFRYDYRMLASLATDEYYLNDDKYNSTSTLYVKGAYIWEEFDYSTSAIELFWGGPYKQIFYANVVLEGLDKIIPRLDEEEEYNDIKGAALFFRARAFYTLAVQFAEPYIDQKKGEALGVPLRLQSEIIAPVGRSSLKETYDQITDDLKEAIGLLRSEIPSIKVIVSKPAAMGLLARCYLSMADYESAFIYADLSLKLYDKLMNFNTLNLGARFPFSLYNEEVIHDAPFDPIIGVASSPNAIVNNELYDLYGKGDLRSQVFFADVVNIGYSFRGPYHGDWGNWGGVSTNEMFLIRAEAAVRLEKFDLALNDINTLLVNRYKSGSFEPWVFSEKEELLTKILLERRKELLFRGLRWEDLRRLNREPGREETLSRTIGGKTYTLKPNDLRYVFKIPEGIVLETGIQQND